MSTVRSVVISVVAASSVIVVAGCGVDTSAPQSDSRTIARAVPTPADVTGRMQVGPTPPPPSTLRPVPADELAPFDGVVAPTIAVDDVRIEVDADTGAARVVYRFTGAGVPFWKVGYVAEAVPHGGGPSLVVAGQTIMQIDIMGTAKSARDLYSAATPLAGPEGSRVVQLFLLPDTRDTNGVTQSFVGLRGGPRPFEVAAVEDPPQLIVEIR
ncbi:hypothetical protein M2284_000976 [Rhodococcus sp. LBL1]|nr:hypothetical protein [Rhodococcus sp. LBL1]MDH6682929.1 hypothetical protein [Rhodococcus sp. LBL2]